MSGIVTDHQVERWPEAADRFFELSIDLLCVVDRQGRFVHLSRSWQDFLGLSLADLRGRAFIDFVHPDDLAATLEAFRQHGLGYSVAGFCNRYRTPGGDYRHLSWRSSPPDQDGLIHAVARDVTDDTLAHRILAEEQARLRAVMDSIADLVFIKDNDFRYLGCNRPFSEFMGRGEDEMVGRTDFDFFSEEQARSFRANDIATLGGMALRRCDEWLTCPDGRRRLFDTQKVPLITADGRVAGLVGVSRDITEQSELRGRVEFLGEVVNRSRDPLYCVNPARDYAFAYVNDALCTLLAAPRDEIMASPLSRFCAALERPVLDELWRQVCAGDAPVMIQLSVRAVDGTVTPVEISASRVHHDGEDYAVGWVRDVSARQAAERQLREREILYRASIEATLDGFWQLDGHGVIIDANSAYARMSGYTVEELRGMPISALEAVERPEDVAARIERLRRCGVSTFESRHRRKDGSLWDVEVSVLSTELGGGRFFAYVRDPRRRRRAELLLKARLDLAEKARGNDIDGLATAILDTAERLTASTIGFFHFVDPDQDSLRLQAWSSNTVASLCQAEGKGRHYPVALAGLWAQGLRDGRPFVCNDFAAAIGKRGMPAGHVQIHRLVAVPVAGEGGFAAIIGVGNKAEDYDDDDVSILGELAAMAMDIVNRVRAEELRRHLADELARVAQQWSAALESFQGGIAVLDRDHGLLRANAAFYTLTGARGAELSSQATAFLSPLLVSGGGDMVLEAGDPANPSGRPLEVRVAPLGDGAGAVDGLVVSLYDLTHAREQERRLEQMVGELTSSNAELERFGQVAAHDLQEPTRRQVLFAQMLQRRLDAHLDEESRQYLGFLINDALKMRDMVRALNVYHHAGQTLQPAEMVDLDRVAADVLGTLAAEVDASGARFCLSPLGEVVGERARLHLLLVNLLSNALKFRHPQRVPRIHLGREAVEDGLGLFRVADNGVGIPEQYRAGLFSLFRRLSPDQGGRSSGMGLAQCRRIVEDMGGRIWVEGNDQGGTTVKFTLPQGRKQTAFNRTQAATSGH